MIEEYEEDLTFTLSAGVQRVIWSGCMIPKVNLLFHFSLEIFHIEINLVQIYTKAPCPIDITGIANNITTYRHVGYDAFNELFYLCDVASGKVEPIFPPAWIYIFCEKFVRCPCFRRGSLVRLTLLARLGQFPPIKNLESFGRFVVVV